MKFKTKIKESKILSSSQKKEKKWNLTFNIIFYLINVNNNKCFEGKTTRITQQTIINHQI